MFSFCECPSYLIALSGYHFCIEFVKLTYFTMALPTVMILNSGHSNVSVTKRSITLPSIPKVTAVLKSAVSFCGLSFQNKTTIVHCSVHHKTNKFDFWHLLSWHSCEIRLCNDRCKQRYVMQPFQIRRKISASPQNCWQLIFSTISSSLQLLIISVCVHDDIVTFNFIVFGE